MTGEQAGSVEREAELARVFKRMGKAARRGDLARYEELRAEHDRLKSAHVEASHAEMKAAMRARRAQERAQVAAVAPRRWKLPAGFGKSPGAVERDRQGRAVVPVIPVGRPALSPWRRGGGLMSQQIWRPGP